MPTVRRKKTRQYGRGFGANMAVATAAPIVANLLTQGIEQAVDKGPEVLGKVAKRGKRGVKWISKRFNPWRKKRQKGGRKRTALSSLAQAPGLSKMIGLPNHLPSYVQFQLQHATTSV